MLKGLLSTCLIISCFGTIGCSQKREQIPTSISISALSSLTGSTDGGLFFAGRSSEGKEFRMGLPEGGQSLSLTLDAGKWTFYTIAWEGPHPMEGTHRCNVTETNLAVGQQNIAIELTQDKCRDGRLANNSNSIELNAFIPSGEGGGFKALELNPCIDISRVSAQGSNCRGLGYGSYEHPLVGQNLSYRIRTLAKNLEDTRFSHLESRCYGPDQLNFSATSLLTALRLPLGGSAKMFPFEILAYEDQQCKTYITSYRFEDIQRQTTGLRYRLPASSYTPMISTLYFSDNFVGTSAPVLSRKMAFFDCGPNKEHCLPGMPTAMGASTTDINIAFRQLERIISNGADIDSHDMGEKALLQLGDYNLYLETLEPWPAERWGEFSVQISPAPPGIFEPYQVSYIPEAKTFSLYLSEGTCSNPIYTTVFECESNSELWTPSSMIMTGDVESTLQGLITQYSLPLRAFSISGGGTYMEYNPSLFGHYELVGGREARAYERLNSALSDISEFTVGPLLAALGNQITTCQQIPTAGASQKPLIVEGQTFMIKLAHSVGQELVPEWYSSTASRFEKRIDFFINNRHQASLEFNCDAFAEGWLHIKELETGTGSVRHELAVQWSTNNPANARIDTYYHRNTDEGPHYEISRLQKTSVDVFEFFHSRTYETPLPYADKYQMVRVRGNKNAYFMGRIASESSLNVSDIESFSNMTSGNECYEALSGEINISACNFNLFPFEIPSAPTLASNWASSATSNWNNRDYFECPIGNYILVPGNPALGTTSFCVMKYEARDNLGVPVSMEAGAPPWNNISAPLAKNACRGLGDKYDLISNAQWMTIARNIELQEENWDSGILARGWAASSALGDGWTNTKAPDAAEVLCRYNMMADGCYQTGVHKHRRTLLLSNGEEIWDFSGSLSEWVDWAPDGSNIFTKGPVNCSSLEVEFSDIAQPCDIEDHELLPETPGLTRDDGVGSFAGGTGGAARRGGVYGNGKYAGAFALSLDIDETAFHVEVGFRCVWNP